jgi:hypothetical protein
MQNRAVKLIARSVALNDKQFNAMGTSAASACIWSVKPHGRLLRGIAPVGGRLDHRTGCELGLGQIYMASDGTHTQRQRGAD